MHEEFVSPTPTADSDDRFRRGLDILFGMSSKKTDILTSRLAEVAPDFARLTIEFAFGAIFTRDVLDLRARELIAVSVLTARGDATAALRAHVASALNFGISQAEVVETMMQVSIYAGFPVVINALTECHDLLTSAADSECASCPDPVQRAEVGQV